MLWDSLPTTSNGAMNKFYYELDKNGVQSTGAPEVPEYELDESKFENPALRAILVLAVRYELGSSFFAHPNVEGNKQIATAVLETLTKGTTAKEDAEKLVSEEAIYQEAKRQCQQMVLQTKARLADLRRASNEYMDDALRRTEEAVAMSLEDVRDTRAKFKALIDAQEKRNETPVEDTEA